MKELIDFCNDWPEVAKLLVDSLVFELATPKSFFGSVPTLTWHVGFHFLIATYYGNDSFLVGSTSMSFKIPNFSSSAGVIVLLRSLVVLERNR